MANDTLKNALHHAGLTPEEFAEIVRVDPKTVGRWLAGTTTPYPRHRATIARALDLPQHQLWPDDTPPSGPAPHPAASDAAAGSDVTGTWAYDTGAAAPDPAAFITATSGPIAYLDNGRGIAPTPDLIHALIDQATAGRPVRLATDLPERQYELLIGHPHIEIRVIHAGPSHSLLRAGDVALATLNLSVEGDQPPPSSNSSAPLAGGCSTASSPTSTRSGRTPPRRSPPSSSSTTTSETNTTGTTKTKTRTRTTRAPANPPRPLPRLRRRRPPHPRPRRPRSLNGAGHADPTDRREHPRRVSLRAV